MGHVVCFGELLLRLTAPGRELLLQNGRFEVHVGGAEANVAIGLARLGHQTAMISRLPHNALGDAAIGHLRRFGVDVDGVAFGEGRMGLYFLSAGAGLRRSEILYDRQGSSFALAGKDDFDWDRLLAGASLLHMSGITPALGPRSVDAALAIADAARLRDIRISFDGNYRAQLWQGWDSDPKAILSELVGKTDIFFGNHRDISLLLGRDVDGEGSQRRREAAEAAFDRFPRLQMIASTARHIDNADRHRIAARVDTHDSGFQTEEVVIAGIVDRIGTGDAFAAGVLHGILTGQDDERTARYGLALACLKHSLPGDASLFTQADIDAFLSGELEVRR
jgi:2-dehydro-3-deoxygluconokinase